MSHALLSASASKRWLTCTPSARLEEAYPDTTTKFTEEGSLAHSIADVMVLRDIKVHESDMLDNGIAELSNQPLFSKDMIHNGMIYVDEIKGIMLSYKNEPYVITEQTVHYDKWVPEGFGTADCLIVGDNKLSIVDYKYGQGVAVQAENNSQMRLYALGAYDEYNFMYDIQEVSMTIVQPRLNSITNEIISIDELLSWGDEVKPIAQAAYNGEGEFCAGEHCRFCKIKATCRHRSEHYLKLNGYVSKDIKTLLPEEYGEILKIAEGIEEWIKVVKDHAFESMMDGIDIPGYKIVAGKSDRTITDITKAIDLLNEHGFDKDLFYERKVVSMTGMEKVVGKKQFNEILGDLIVKSEPKPTMVNESDKRKPIKLKPTIDDDFDDDINFNGGI